jgi:hypothetical protein
MSQTSESSIPASPSANVLPQTTVNQPIPGFTVIQTPTAQDALNEVENLSAFIVALKAAVANSSTWAAFQTAVAALPNA